MRSGLKPAPGEQADRPVSQPSPAAPPGYARLLPLLLVPVLALPAFLLGVILIAIWTRTPHVPYFDEWELVLVVQHWNQGTLSLGELWAFHNEHRIFLPRILQLFLILTTHWNRQIEMSFGLALSVVEAVLLYLSLRKLIGSALLSLVSVLPLSLLVFSLSQYENWLAPFQMTFILTALGVALCVFGLREGAGRFGFALALAGAVVAALSSLGGLFAFIAFLPAVCTLGYRKTAPWLAVAAAIGIPYFIGFPHSVPIALSPDLVTYVLGYLGAPVGFPDAPQAYLAGACSFILAGANLALLARQRRQIAALLTWLGLGLFALCQAISTALGRFQVESAVEVVSTTRYQVFAALWWVFVLALVVKNLTDCLSRSLRADIISRRPAHAGVAVMNGLAFGLLYVSLAGVNLAAPAYMNSFQSTKLLDEPCVVNYAFASPLCLQQYHPQAAFVQQYAPYLQQQHLAIFSGADAKMRVPLPNPPAHELVRYAAVPPSAYSDSWSTVSYGIWVRKQGATELYAPVGELGYLYDAAQPGTQALYGCMRNSASQPHHFVSLQRDCEGAKLLQLEGWLYLHPPSGVQTVALYACAAGQMRFISRDARCEWQTLLGPLGYALATP